MSHSLNDPSSPLSAVRSPRFRLLANGVLAPATQANVDANAPAGSTYMVAGPLACMWRNQTLMFAPGPVYSLDPALLGYLLSLGAICTPA